MSDSFKLIRRKGTVFFEVEELRNKLKEIHKIIISEKNKGYEIDWNLPDCKSKMFSIITEMTHTLAKIEELCK